jgi:hypothetical protein
MRLLDWIRGHGKRRRARIAKEESTLSAQDRAAIQSWRESKLPRGGSNY